MGFILETGCWLLVAGCWAERRFQLVGNAGYSMLDARWWIPVSGFFAKQYKLLVSILHICKIGDYSK